MWFLLATAAAGTPLIVELPPDQPAAEWAECLALAGLVSGKRGESPWVEIIDGGDTWTVRAHGPGQPVRELTVAEPRVPNAREDVAILAASLLRPMTSARPATPPAPTPEAPPEVPAPAPKPAATRPRPATAVVVIAAPPPPEEPPAAPEPPAEPVAPVVEAPPATSPPGTRPPSRLEIGAGAAVGVRADALPSPVLTGELRERFGAFAVGVAAQGALAARLPDLTAAPTVGTVGGSVLGEWRPVIGAGLELGVELGATWFFFDDEEGNALHEPVPRPRVAARVGWSSPALGHFEVAPYVRGAWMPGALELKSERDGDRELAPWVVDVGTMIRFNTEKVAE